MIKQETLEIFDYETDTIKTICSSDLEEEYLDTISIFRNKNKSVDMEELTKSLMMAYIDNSNSYLDLYEDKYLYNIGISKNTHFSDDENLFELMFIDRNELGIGLVTQRFLDEDTPIDPNGILVANYCVIDLIRIIKFFGFSKRQLDYMEEKDILLALCIKDIKAKVNGKYKEAYKKYFLEDVWKTISPQTRHILSVLEFFETYQNPNDRLDLGFNYLFSNIGCPTSYLTSYAKHLINEKFL